MTLFIGVTGPCGSGKTVFSNQLAKVLSMQNISSTIINSDHYYNDDSHLSVNEKKDTNFCAPDRIDFALLENHLSELEKGNSVERPCYNIGAASREKSTVTLESAQVIIIEGLLIFHSTKIRDFCQFKIFIDLKLDVCLSRRLLRDHYERKQPYEFILNTYETLIRPSFFQYTQHFKDYSNLVIRTDRDLKQALNELPNIVVAQLDSDTNANHDFPTVPSLSKL